MRALGLFVQLRQLGRKALVPWTPQITHVTHGPPLAEGPPGEGWMGRQNTQLCAWCQMCSGERCRCLQAACDFCPPGESVGSGHQILTGSGTPQLFRAAASSL